MSLEGEVYPLLCAYVQSYWSLHLDADEECIAHLLPCKHDLHNACLKPWVERANSCPICRAKFNMVELSRVVGGAVEGSYAVQDKVQEPELDPTMIVEDELFAVEAWESCILCGDSDDTHELMYCDSCEQAVHVFCAGFDDAPVEWYCEACSNVLGTSTRRRPRRLARRNRRGNDTVWARVWQEVSRRLDLDLDFPFDDEVTEERTPAQRRELLHWERRLGVAQQQGAATDRLRDIAAGRVGQQARVEPKPESQEEIRAWNAFDKARETGEAAVASRRRKRKATASPASPHDAEQSQPQLKRPRTRAARPPPQPDNIAEASAVAAQGADDRSTFLSSLLKDVENKPLSAGSPAASDQYGGQWSPRNSSPARSPSSSGPGTPRALSPMPQQAPISPPLSSTILPDLSTPAAIFSPFSPPGAQSIPIQLHEQSHRGRQRTPQMDRRGSDTSIPARASSGSPSRNLSFSAKEEIQRMVKLALAPRYREKEISKDQYTDINRDVSRQMYDLVGDASALTDHRERERWQCVAEEQVKTAISELHFGSGDDLV
ncbi:hypothetical protein LTR86_004388 [Recurvomyces mirabilis]|nr:hypothetical protein LTR86_004388 [Recurvomyces mirabilis]